MLVFAPGDLAAVAEPLPHGVETTPLPVVDAVAAYLTPDEIETLADE